MRASSPHRPWASWSAVSPRVGGSLRACLTRLDRVELVVVRHQVGLRRHRVLRQTASVLTLIGNGWLYVPLAALALAVHRSRAVPVLAVSVASVLCAHAIYAVIKRAIGRPRPCERSDDVLALCEPLDRYSFPSGHSMTACAALTPLVAAFPGWIVPSALLWIVLGWARLTAGHHYPSDVIAGAVIGGIVALAIGGVTLG